MSPQDGSCQKLEAMSKFVKVMQIKLYQFFRTWCRSKLYSLCKLCLQ